MPVPTARWLSTAHPVLVQQPKRNPAGFAGLIHLDKAGCAVIPPLDTSAKCDWARSSYCHQPLCYCCWIKCGLAPLSGDAPPCSARSCALGWWAATWSRALAPIAMGKRAESTPAALQQPSAPPATRQPWAQQARSAPSALPAHGCAVPGSCRCQGDAQPDRPLDTAKHRDMGATFIFTFFLLLWHTTKE